MTLTKKKGKLLTKALTSPRQQSACQELQNKKESLSPAASQCLSFSAGNSPRQNINMVEVSIERLHSRPGGVFTQVYTEVF